MDASSQAYAILMQWAVLSPVLLVYFLGAVLALTYWQTRRLAAGLTLCAMVLLGALTLITPVIWLGLPEWQSEHGWTLKQMGFVSATINLISSVLHAVSIGLLLAAVFYRRSAPPILVPSNLPPSPPFL